MDAVVVPGPAAADALRDLGVHESRIFEGFNAVDVARFAAVAHLAPEGEGHRYLFVGQLIERKNVDGLIHAFARCRRPEDSLTIVGTGEQGASLEHLVARSGLGSTVQFVGSLAYELLPNLMADHHTLVLPSTEEVWGLVVNEALAAGRHVVVSDQAGVAQSVSGMPGVYVCPPATGLQQAMADSRQAWAGPRRDPAIARHTPEAFAEVFLSSFERTG
ncbi:glycosyltransferase family 4 protein [Microbacterium sp. Yaish 1]|uniref:glycosyltransferase family 4 protein n=1 Tax=Microbacterium sp. Yaish 1 TaxID=2025014 RepID=UPI0015C6845E|nr:glycosyltransferase family 4 protein [Microbacterium sp. Yaish 1]